MLLSALSALARRGRFRPAARSPRRTFRPGLEALEDRLVPAPMHWTVTSPADNGAAHTLRWAVAKAKSGDTIDITTSQTIVLTHGELVLAHDLTIDFAGFANGHQATISGDFHSRVFEVAPRADVNLEDLVLIDGNGEANNPKGTKGADGKGGAIFNRGTLALTHCTLSDNGVTRDAPFGNVWITAQLGGGIYNQGPFYHFGNLTLTKCDLHNNSAGFGGGIDNVGGNVDVRQCSLENNHAVSGGGGIANDLYLTVWDHSDFDQNTAFEGGGIYNRGLSGFVDVSHCQFDGNRAQLAGGGIYNNDKGSVRAEDCTFTDNQTTTLGGGVGGAIYSAGSLLLSRCDFEDNHSTAWGGAIYYSLTANIEGCTLTQNSAPGLGGGIYSGGLATLAHCTLTNNSASAGGGIYMDSKAILAVGTSTFSGNTPDNLDKTLGTFLDFGGNTGI
jgi:predicted outer membrane repeat protein